MKQSTIFWGLGVAHVLGTSILKQCCNGNVRNSVKQNATEAAAALCDEQ
jgi:hypothetical protein